MQLTNDADKLVCQLYKAYLEKRKSGIDKLNSKQFSFDEIKSLKPFIGWSESDIASTIAELSKSNFGAMYLDKGFSANDQFIIYMENRFKNGLSEVIDFIAKFMP